MPPLGKKWNQIEADVAIFVKGKDSKKFFVKNGTKTTFANRKQKVRACAMDAHAPEIRHDEGADLPQRSSSTPETLSNQLILKQKLRRTNN
jgi:hypothetical protein